MKTVLLVPAVALLNVVAPAFIRMERSAVNASGPVYSSNRSNASDLGRHAGRDRGTFILKCEQAEEACNNICYDLLCRNGPTTFMRENDHNKNNRQQSGCNVGSHPRGSASVCNNDLFLQKFGYPQGLDNPDCDEWPANVLRQPPYSSPNHHRNSLRCMPYSPNRRAGRMLGEFLNDMGDNPGLKGKGKIEGDDFFGIDFNDDHADKRQAKMPYCENKGKTHPKCDNDGFQFYMSHLQGDKGKLNEAYDYNKDNHYALVANDDIKRCKVAIHRHKNQKGLVDYDITLLTDGGAQLDHLSRPAEYSITVFELHIQGKIFQVTAQSQGENSPISFEYEDLSWDLSSGFGKNHKLWCFNNSGPKTDCIFPCFHN